MRKIDFILKMDEFLGFRYKTRKIERFELLGWIFGRPVLSKIKNDKL